MQPSFLCRAGREDIAANHAKREAAEGRKQPYKRVEIKKDGREKSTKSLLKRLRFIVFISGRSGVKHSFKQLN